MPPARCAVFLISLALAATVPALPARAEITHIVRRGHTLEAIAHRYHVTVKAILDANHLSDPKSLRPGQTLIIPGVEPAAKGRKSRRDPAENPGEPRAGSLSPDRGSEAPLRGPSDAVRAERLGEEFRIRVKDPHGHIPASALKAFERMMRQGNAMHSVDPRLVAPVGIVSNHFGGRTIEVVSGYRAYTPTQYTPHSNHNYGRALDFRVRGVSNEALRDFCRTLRSAGCGYYPNSSFVHLDVRETKAYWVDWSRPGEAPRYEKPGGPADEGAGEVVDETNEPPARPEPSSAADSPPEGSPEPHAAVPIESNSK
jgi:uncharacterized protein YcbK (DUF882 family)